MKKCHGFPISRTEVGPKRAATLQEKHGVNHERGGAHDVGVVLELFEAQLDIVCVDGNVTVGKGDA